MSAKEHRAAETLGTQNQEPALDILRVKFAPGHIGMKVNTDVEFLGILRTSRLVRSSLGRRRLRGLPLRRGL